MTCAALVVDVDVVFNNNNKNNETNRHFLKTWDKGERSTDDAARLTNFVFNGHSTYVCVPVLVGRHASNLKSESRTAAYGCERKFVRPQRHGGFAVSLNIRKTQVCFLREGSFPFGCKLGPFFYEEQIYGQPFTTVVSCLGWF